MLKEIGTESRGASKRSVGERKTETDRRADKQCTQSDKKGKKIKRNEKNVNMIEIFK